MRGLGIHLRRARQEDALLLWCWANDPEVRNVSFHPEAIPWEAHNEWLEHKLAEGQCIFIAHDDSGVPFGIVRFAISGESAVISTSVEENHRGCGYGAALIYRGCQQCFEETPARVVHALIKKTNRASLSAFQRAGFVWSRDLMVSGQDAGEYILTKPS
jgi:RimJ/RimL family protein N-acetyltransferase